MVIQQPKFHQLKKWLNQGQNLLIIEPDGPHFESNGYYLEKYGYKDLIDSDGTLLLTQEIFDLMLNDPKHAFGHGYCLAGILLGLKF